MPRGAHLEDSVTGDMFLFVNAEDRSGEAWRFLVRKPGPNPNLRSKASFASFELAKEAANRYWKANRDVMIKANEAYRMQREVERAAEEAAKEQTSVPAQKKAVNILGPLLQAKLANKEKE